MLQRIGFPVFLMFLPPPPWGQAKLPDTLILYHISGFNGGRPSCSLAISTGGILHLQTRDFTVGGDTLGDRMNPLEFSQIQKLLEDNGFQSEAVEKTKSSQALSGPVADPVPLVNPVKTSYTIR